MRGLPMADINFRWEWPAEQGNRKKNSIAIALSNTHFSILLFRGL